MVSIPKWDSVMVDEYSSLMNNNTLDCVPLLKERNLVWCKWVYHTKYVVDSSIDIYKAHLFWKVFSLVEGIDYSKNFSLIAMMNFFHLVLSIVAS